MKKTHILSALAMAGAISSASAATAGPDNFGYVANSTDFAWFEVGNETLTNDDDEVANVSLGFNFSFYGASYSDVYITDNGILTFGGGNGNFVNGSFGSVGMPQPTIAPLWNDWVTWQTEADMVLYGTTGAVGDRYFTATWQLVSRYSGQSEEDTVMFQAVLSEADGSIQFNYLDATGTGMDESTVGISSGLNAPVNGRYLDLNVNNEGPFGSLMDGDAILITLEEAPVPEVHHYATMLGGLLVGAHALRRRFAKR